MKPTVPTTDTASKLSGLFTFIDRAFAGTIPDLWRNSKQRSRAIHHTPPSAALREEIRQHNAQVHNTRDYELACRTSRQWDRLLGCVPNCYLNNSARRRMKG